MGPPILTNSREAEMTFGCGSKPMGSHFGVGAPPILVYFSGEWDIHWGYGFLTHGHLIQCSWAQSLWDYQSHDGVVGDKAKVSFECPGVFGFPRVGSWGCFTSRLMDSFHFLEGQDHLSVKYKVWLLFLTK